MLLRTSVLLTLAFFIFSATRAKADHIDDGKFRETIEVVLANGKGLFVQPIYDAKAGLQALSAVQMRRFNEISKFQGEIWGDTILEGDYQADGKTRIDRVEALSLDGQLLAYHITYSERAWDMSECTYPGNLTTDALSLCQEGRIEEASFVSPELSSWTRDSEQLAVFTKAAQKSCPEASF